MFLQWSPYLHWCRCDAKARNSWRMCALWTCWRPTEILSKKPRQAQFLFKACNKLSSDHARLRRKSTFSAWDVMTPVTRWRIRPADFLFQVILFHVLHLVITSWFIGQRLKTLLQVVKNFEVLKTWFEFFGRDTPYGNEIKACLVFSTLRLICWQQYIYGFQTSGVLHLQVAVLELNESLRVLDDGRKSDKKARGTWMEFIPISIRNSSKVKCLDLAISGSSGGGHEDSTGLQSTSDWHAHAWATIPKIKAGEHTKTTHTHTHNNLFSAGLEWTKFRSSRTLSAQCLDQGPRWARPETYN